MFGATFNMLAALVLLGEPSQSGSIQLTIRRSSSDDDVVITVSAANGEWWAKSVRPDGQAVLTNGAACADLVPALHALADLPPRPFYLRGISPPAGGGGGAPYHDPVYSISGVYGGDGAFGLFGVTPVNGPFNTWARNFVDTISRCETVPAPEADP